MEPNGSTVAGNAEGRSSKKRKLQRFKQGDPSKDHCQFWLMDKNRYCRLNPLNDSTVCAEHIAKGGYSKVVMEDGRVRVPCPLNNRHTCFEDNIEKHVLKCNDRPVEQPSYIMTDVNVFEPGQKMPHNTSGNGRMTSEYNGTYSMELTDSEMSRAIRGALSLHQRDVGDMDRRYGCHPVVAGELVRSDIGHDAARHFAQIGSIINLLQEEDLVKEGTCFIEFGSGRGSLSYHIMKLVLEKKLDNCSFVLVDRTSPRHKQDNRLKDSGLEIHRIRADIKDLVISELPGVQSINTKHIVGVAKHLCGGATDLALQSLFSKWIESEVISKVAGAVVATCCHHRCESQTYVGRNFVTRKFNPPDFHILTRLGAWATDGDFVSLVDENVLVVEENRRFLNTLAKSVPNLFVRNTIGNMVKEVIDFGRKEYIEKEHSGTFLAEITKYVDTQTTLENTAIVVRRATSKLKQQREEKTLQIAKRVHQFKEALKSTGEYTGLGHVF